jgi:glycosyltransferase involved in cell wall biosynthesis
MISIIIPTHNRGSLIFETIDSVLNQTFKNIEIIVVDDHSSDNTKSVIEEIIKKDSRVSYHIRPDDLLKGGNSCRNYGFHISKGEFLIWLDSDDLLKRNYFEIQYESLTKSSSDLVICGSKSFGLKSEIQSDSSLPNWGDISNEFSLRNFLNNKFIWQTGAALWRKSYFQNIAPFNEDLQNSQEWLMHLEQLTKGVSASVNLESMVFVRKHSGGMSDRSNKFGEYYFNQSIARIEAIRILKNIPNLKTEKNNLYKDLLWFHLFTFYKGGWLFGLKLFLRYFKLFK